MHGQGQELQPAEPSGTEMQGSIEAAAAAATGRSPSEETAKQGRQSPAAADPGSSPVVAALAQPALLAAAVGSGSTAGSSCSPQSLSGGSCSGRSSRVGGLQGLRPGWVGTRGAALEILRQSAEASPRERATATPSSSRCGATPEQVLALLSALTGALLCNMLVAGAHILASVSRCSVCAKRVLAVNGGALHLCEKLLALWQVCKGFFWGPKGRCKVRAGADAALPPQMGLVLLKVKVSC